MLPVIKQQMRHLIKFRPPKDYPEGGFATLDDAWGEVQEQPAYFWWDTKLVESALSGSTAGNAKVSGLQGYVLVEDPIPFGSKVEVYFGEEKIVTGFASVLYAQQNFIYPEYYKVPVGDWIYPGFTPKLATFKRPSASTKDSYNQIVPGFADIPGFVNCMVHHQVYSVILEENNGSQLCGFIMIEGPSFVLGTKIVLGSESYQITEAKEFGKFSYYSGRLMDDGVYCKGPGS